MFGPSDFVNAGANQCLRHFRRGLRGHLLGPDDFSLIFSNKNSWPFLSQKVCARERRLFSRLHGWNEAVATFAELSLVWTKRLSRNFTGEKQALASCAGLETPSALRAKRLFADFHEREGVALFDGKGLRSGAPTFRQIWPSPWRKSSNFMSKTMICQRRLIIRGGFEPCLMSHHCINAPVSSGGKLNGQADVSLH